MSFVPSKTSLYKFSSLMNEKMVLDMSQMTDELNKAIVWEWAGGSNQKFAIRQVSGGKFAIFCAKNNMVLIPEGGSNGNGARAMLGSPQKSEIEFWTLELATNKRLGNRRGYILKSHCGKALDICEGSCKNGQQIIQWDLNGNENQIWIIQEV